MREQARNLGVGARLMSAIAAHAADDELLIRWGAEMENVDAHRFYRRIGASLRPKMQAIWTARVVRPSIHGPPDTSP